MHFECAAVSSTCSRRAKGHKEKMGDGGMAEAEAEAEAELR